MIVDALQRTQDLIRATPEAEFAGICECDLHRVLVHRFLARAMNDMGLDDFAQRGVVLWFRRLGSGLTDPQSLPKPLRGTLVEGLGRVAAESSLRNRTLASLGMIIEIARWYWPRKLSQWESAGGGEARAVQVVEAS